MIAAKAGRPRRASAVVWLALAWGAGLASGQDPAGSPAASVTVPLTDAEKERFLLDARIVSRRSAPQGVTGTERVTLALDGVEHDAHVQQIDEHKLHVQLSGGTEVDFRDTWRNNVAAYRLDRLLGLRMVPVTVQRRDRLELASFTWWVDDFLMDEKQRLKRKVRTPDVDAWNRQMYTVRIFDQLIYNFDRNAGNLLIDKAWRMWMIDHSRAFKTFPELKSAKSLGARCPRELLAALRRLDKPTLEQSMEDLLGGPQIEGLLGRRDAIVRYFDDRIARSGEGAVLYDLPPRLEPTGATR